MNFIKTDLKKDSRKSQNIAISNSAYRKFSNHIRILKNLESRSVTNQVWILNAIHRKLDQNEKLLQKEIPQQKIINVKIDTCTHTKILEQVEIFKKHTGAYSTTKWILEAIMDQMEEESEKVNELLKQQAN